jgi:Fels-1 Prophage Protein-like
MDNRFVRPRSDVVCDRATSICYKRGKIDKSDTEHVFGERAGDRADDVRDRLSNARVFVPERGVACDRERRICLEDGDPDRRLTRRYFGRRAARALN